MISKKRIIENTFEESRFLPGVNICNAVLKSLSTGDEEGTVLLYLKNTFVTVGYDPKRVTAFDFVFIKDSASIDATIY